MSTRRLSIPLHATTDEKERWGKGNLTLATLFLPDRNAGAPAKTNDDKIHASRARTSTSIYRHNNNFDGSGAHRPLRGHGQLGSGEASTRSLPDRGAAYCGRGVRPRKIIPLYNKAGKACSGPRWTGRLAHCRDRQGFLPTRTTPRRSGHPFLRPPPGVGGRNIHRTAS